MLRTALALAGLKPSEFALVSPSKLAHVYRKYGLFLALQSALKTWTGKSFLLLWRVLAPYVLIRQVLCVLVLQLLHDGLLPSVRDLLFGKQDKQRHAASKCDPTELARLHLEMDAARTYDEWRDASRLHDAILERTIARHELPVLALQRLERMRHKTALYDELVQRKDVFELQFRLRSEIHRKQWGLGGNQDEREHSEYREALNQYLTVVCEALALIAKGRVDEDMETPAEELRNRIRFFSETLHSFGRTALLLSGGARLGLQHLGVIKALRDQKLIPKVISGSSAGSIVAVMLGCYRDDELDEHLFAPENLNLRFFEFVSRESSQVLDDVEPTKQPWLSSLLLLPPPFPLLFHAFSNVLPTYWKTGALLNVHVLSKAIRDAIGDMTFLEAFHRTGRIINITVSPTGSGGNDFPMLLNYLTAPQVLMWSASVASCAIPGVFASVELLAKDKDGNLVPYYPEGMKWADGSVEADLPMQRLAELFNVNNFVVSQVNPHARFLAPIQTVRVDAAYGKAFEVTTKTIVDFCRDQCRSSVKHFASMIMSLPELPLITPVLRGLGKSLVPILTQKYTGSITIMPPLSMHGMATILVNPTAQEFLEDIERGQRMTWPHISKLRLSVAIEFLLDDCRQACMAKLAVLNSGGSPRIVRKMGIPTASVLNLQEIASLQTPVQDKQSLNRQSSFLALSNKLKNRVESFADDLTVMRDLDAKFNHDEHQLESADEEAITF